MDHSPAPWRRTFGTTIDDAEGHTIAVLWPNEANASLVVAAPMLLDLLQRMHERLTDGRQLPDWMEGWPEEVEAAIAKAEGH